MHACMMTLRMISGRIAGQKRESQLADAESRESRVRRNREIIGHEYKQRENKERSRTKNESDSLGWSLSAVSHTSEIFLCRI